MAWYGVGTVRSGHALLALLACGCSGGSSATSPQRDEAGSDAAAVAVVPVPAARPIGLDTLDGFAYRRGPGRADYERAVKAEKKARGDDDWKVVIAACRAARAADPGHLDAAWLEAAALARIGAHAEILAPLSVAVAGDWAKWGERSLTLPLFGDFLASAHGEAWRQLAEDYRAAFATAARGAVIVLGRDGPPHGAELDRRAEVYAWAPADRRWLRLTHTGGTVVAALPAPDGGVVAYVAYRQLTKAVDRKVALVSPGVAVIELATGRVGRELPFTDVIDLRLGWKAGKNGADPTLIAAIRAPKTAPSAGTWILDWKREHAKRPAAGQKLAVGRDALVVTKGVARRLRAPVAGVTADWDDDGLASAIRLDDTRKTVTPPAGLVVDGHGLVWSPDRARLALVAVAEADCAAPATVFVVDAGTGTLRKLGASAAPAPAWLDATHLAYTDGDRVRLVDVTTAKPTGELTSAAGVATAIVSRPCAPPSDEALFAPDPDELLDESVEPAGATPPPTDSDAGVVNDAQPVGPPTPADPPK